MITAPAAQMRNESKKPYIHKAAPNTYDAMKRATLEAPRVALGMASGKMTNTTSPKEILANSENQGSSFELAHTPPRMNREPSSATAARATPDIRRLGSVANAFLTAGQDPIRLHNSIVSSQLH
jgi:hypothetical protein